MDQEDVVPPNQDLAHILDRADFHFDSLYFDDILTKLDNIFDHESSVYF